MKFSADHPYANPEAAMRKLLEYAKAYEPPYDSRIYIEKINAPFLFEAKGSPEEYKAGLELAIELAGVDAKIGVCFTAQVAGHARKLDAYIALARLVKSVPASLNKAFEQLPKKLQTLSERRNRVVHDVWHFDYPNPPHRFEATARKTLRLELVPVSTSSVLLLEQEILREADSLTELVNRVEALPGRSV